MRLIQKVFRKKSLSQNINCGSRWQNPTGRKKYDYFLYQMEMQASKRFNFIVSIKSTWICRILCSRVNLRDYVYCACIKCILTYFLSWRKKNPHFILEWGKTVIWIFCSHFCVLLVRTIFVLFLLQTRPSDKLQSLPLQITVYFSTKGASAHFVERRDSRQMTVIHEDE